MRDCPRICRYLHVPAQHGSDRILKLMNRGYTVQQYRDFLGRAREYMPDVTVASDFIVVRGYGGHGIKLRLEDGKDYPNCRELGGPTHSCSSVALTPKYAFAATVAGLNVRDVKNGDLLWQSPGFAPRGCVNPAVANGRVFWPSAASGMIFCWESEIPKTR